MGNFASNKFDAMDKKKLKELAKTQTMRTAYWVAMTVSIMIGIAGFIVPPLGVIDGSVLVFIGMLMTGMLVYIGILSDVLIKLGVDIDDKQINLELGKKNEEGE